MTIRHFKDEGSRDVAAGINSKKARKAVPASVVAAAQQALDVLDAAKTLSDLQLPGLRLEALKVSPLRTEKHAMPRFSTTTTDGRGPVSLADMRRSPTHPGEIFKTQYREALEPPVSTRQTAFRLGVSVNHMHGIEKGERPVSAEMAVKLAALTGASAEFWMTLQMRYDTWHALQAAKKVRRLIPGEPFPVAARSKAARPANASSSTRRSQST